MSTYKHGIATDRKSAELSAPTTSVKNGVAVIGTAPINRATTMAVNEIVAAYKKADAVSALGDSTDFDSYTLNHSIYAQFNVFGAGPVVFINVLDPSNTKHVSVVTGETVELVAKKATIAVGGILLDKLTLSDGADTTYEADVDYVAVFDDDGYVAITATDDGKLAEVTSVTVAYTKLNPAGVTAEDIIGGVDENGVRTGLELLDEVYPRTGIIPSVILAPGFSATPSVAAALEAKAQLIYGLTNAVAIVDLDSGEKGATTKEQVADQKTKTVVASRWNAVVWPKAIVSGYHLWGSALLAAAIQNTAIQNGGIPSDAPSNLAAYIDGVCLEDGSEIYMTQDQVNDYLNAYGVIGFLKLPTWKFWGNNTAAYPNSTAPQNRFLKSVLMLNWMENTFKTEYLSSIDRNANRKLINDIVNRFNMFMNSLIPDNLAGGYISFDDEENPTDQIASGQLYFHTYYADYAPAEYIQNTFEYDIDLLTAALEGGSE